MSNIGENLSNERIADYYTSLLHVSGADLTSFPSNTVYDGAGHVTGISLSSAGDRVVINNYIMPEGCPTGSDCADLTMSSENPRVKDWLNTFYPVGAIMLTTTPNNPMDKIFGTRWVLESSQRFIVGVGRGVDKNNDVYDFSAGGRGETNGDRAGKYKVTLIDDNLPEHAHVTDTGLAVDEVGGRLADPGTIGSWFPYFGPPINPEGTTQNNSNYREFQGQDRIIAFQNNGSFGGVDEYRDNTIRELYTNNYRYTDADFNPILANRSLRGWAGPINANTTSAPGWTPVARPLLDEAGGVDASGGPGWGGNLYLDRQQELARFVEEVDGAEAEEEAERNPVPIFIGNSPRPIGEQWSRDQLTGAIVDPSVDRDVTYRENVRIVETINDPRATGGGQYIHPGELTNDQIIRAFRIIRHALFDGGAISTEAATDAAREMTAGVTRLRELQEPQDFTDRGPVHGDPGIPSFTSVQIPGYNPVPSDTAGQNKAHNNIPPNYGVYVWRRVEEDFVEEVLDCPEITEGCTNPNATNYNSAATVDDGTCEFTGPVKKGCTDPDADNYDRTATENDPDNPCTYTVTPSIWKKTITSNQKELDLCRWAQANGWNGTDKAEITLASGKYIYSDDNSLGTKKPALTIKCFSDLTFINNGWIMGRGGNGGSKAGGSRSRNGYTGGDAVRVEGSTVIFRNSKKGGIAGGGGGGGGSSTGSNSGGGAGGGWGGTSGRHAKQNYNFTDLDTRNYRSQSKASGSSGKGDGSALGGGKYSSAGGGTGGGLGGRGGIGVYWWGCGIGVKGSLNEGAVGQKKTSIGNGYRQAHAGGSGSGGAEKSGDDPCGTGGGGGRKIPNSGTSEGGIANEIKDGGCRDGDNGNRGGAGGSNANNGSDAKGRAGGGGGGWGARGGRGGSSGNKTGGSGGAGGYAIRIVSGADVEVVGSYYGKVGS